MFGNVRFSSYKNVFVCLVFILPVLFIGFVGYWQIRNVFPEYTKTHLQSSAKFGATILDSQLESLVDLGKVFTTKIQFRGLVAAGKWAEAIIPANALTETGTNNFIDRVFLLNIDGLLMAESSALSTSIVGRNFSYRDYYKGVSEKWRPYVSEIFQKIRSPQYNIFTIAVPIEHSTFKDRLPVGILGLQVSVARFLDWINQIEIGAETVMYVVDQNGHVVAHSKLLFPQPILNFESVPVVQKALKGESGVQMFVDPIDGKKKFAAYEPIPVSGWGIVVEQDITMFSITQSKVLIIFTIIFSIVCLYCYFLSYLVVSSKKPVTS